jgi:hypothetical protein
MPTYTKNNSSEKSSKYGDLPFGNNAIRRIRMETNAAGILKESNATAAVAIADILVLEELPKGFVWHDAIAVVSTAAGQAATVNIGFRYADGVDDASFPQSNTAFFAALALNATSRTSTVTKLPMKPLPKAAYVVAVVAGAALSSASVTQVAIEGEQL